MPNLKLQRRLAAEILGVGEDRVWIDPTKVSEVEKAITREEIRILIHKGVIRALPVRGQSRARTRERHEKRKKGRRRGPGKRKGKKTARCDPKRVWINRIRALRRVLRKLRDSGEIDRRTYRELYMKAKGGFFRSVSHLLLYLKKRE